MAKKQETTGLTVTTDVPTIIERLNKELQSLKHIEETVYKITKANLTGFGEIQSEMRIDNLIKALSSVEMRAEAYAKAANTLGLDTYPVFQVDGGTLDSWTHDIKLRIAILTHKEKLDTLNGFKKEMEGFLSEQDKKALLLQKMEQFLNKQ